MNWNPFATLRRIEEDQRQILAEMAEVRYQLDAARREICLLTAKRKPGPKPKTAISTIDFARGTSQPQPLADPFANTYKS